MLSLLILERQQKDFLKSISNSHITLASLFIWNGNDKFVNTLRNSLKNHTRIQTKNRQNLHPFSDQNDAKTTPFGAAHTYKAYIMALFPAPPAPPPKHTHTHPGDQIIFSFRMRSFANSRQGWWSILNKSLIDKHVLEHRYSYKRALSNNP